MLLAEEILALVRGEHGDPFAVLGPHVEYLVPESEPPPLQVSSKTKTAKKAKKTKTAKKAKQQDPASQDHRQRAVWLRALLPGAVAIEVVPAADPRGPALGSLTRIHDGGLFEQRLTNLDAPYLLRAHFPADSHESEFGFGCKDSEMRETADHGRTRALILEDPYRFGSSIGEFDRYLLGEGTHLRPWTILGAHLREQEGVAGVRFVVWAPNASRVAVIGDFNGWNPAPHGMRLHPGVGLWELFIPGLEAGAKYKYALRDRHGRELTAKADPYAFASELRPGTASIVAPLAKAEPLGAARDAANAESAPISIYEVHLGSWRRDWQNGREGGWLDWDAIAEQLPAYAAALGFTHIELL
ncbi:MAG: hypothetical protein KC431_03325, partial [Myxococcales bacterium]|nr:hypothetical protein [Myxococcales bacterium]